MRDGRLRAIARRAARALATLATIALAGCMTPALPPDAPRPRTIAVTLDGRASRIDVYLPAQPASAAAVLAHGFTRTRATMAGHAAALVADGTLVLVPDLPHFVDPHGNARAIAELVRAATGGAYAPPVQRVVLVGFSAGALSALLAAATPGVVGFVGLDPYDRRSGLGRDAARTLAVPAVLLRAPPSACNAGGVASWAGALQQLQLDRVFDGARHCDFESPSDFICTLACGGPDPQRQQAIGAALRSAIASLLL